MEHFGYGEQDFVPCEICGGECVDVHHIEPKGMGGRHGDEAIKIDRIENLMGLCRKHHDEAHSGKRSKGVLLLEHRYFMSSGGRRL